MAEIISAVLVFLAMAWFLDSSGLLDWLKRKAKNHCYFKL